MAQIYTADEVVLDSLCFRDINTAFEVLQGLKYEPFVYKRQIWVSIYYYFINKLIYFSFGDKQPAYFYDHYEQEMKKTHKKYGNAIFGVVKISI